jgi:hypothetical protein
MHINPHTELREEKGTYFLVIQDITGRIHRLKTNLEDAIAYKSGELIQRAMPYLSADERELIISGVHGHIYDAITNLEETPENEWTSGRMFNDDDKM